MIRNSRLMLKLWTPRPGRSGPAVITHRKSGEAVALSTAARFNVAKTTCAPTPPGGGAPIPSATQPSAGRLSDFLQARIPWTFWGGRA